MGRARLAAILFGLSGFIMVALAGVAVAAVLPPGGSFADDNANVHEGNIEAIAAVGITKGCNPPANTLFCPDASLTRGQMAAFVRRAFSLPSASTDFFDDDNDSVFEGDINAVALAGITSGCNPPANDRFCPEGKVTRGQMAAFLRRAFDYPTATTDYFTDDDSSIFEADINAIAKAGVTLGCNPPANDRYCPSNLVKRDQMASFFARALGLAPIEPPPAPKVFSWSIAGIEGLPWGTDRASAVEFTSRYFGGADYFHDTTPDVGQWCSTAQKHVLWTGGPRLIFDTNDHLVGIEPNDTTSADGIYVLIGLSRVEDIFGIGRRTADPLFGWPMWLHEADEHGTVLSGFIDPTSNPPPIPYYLVAVRVSVPGHEPNCPPVGT